MRGITFIMKIVILDSLHKNPLMLTHLMNSSNLNCTRMRPILISLIERGLVKIIEPNPKMHPKKICKHYRKVRYQLTDKGRNVLKTLRDAREILGELDVTENATPLGQDKRSNIPA